MTKSILFGVFFSFVFMVAPDGYAREVTPLSDSWFPSNAADVVGQPAAIIKNTQVPLPEPPNDDGVYREVDAGNTAVCAIRRDKTIRCWGMNDLGQASPPKGKFKTISMGDVHGCGITVNGRLRCWGGTLGRPSNEKNLGSFIGVLAADSHTCGLRTNHKVICWGSDLADALSAPKGQFKTGDARSERSCGIRMRGDLECWGGNTLRVFEQPSGRFEQVVLGLTHACAIRKNDRSVVCWGNDLYGETKAPEGAFIRLAAGDFHTCGLRDDGGQVCWGRNQFGQNDLPIEKYKRISAGGAINCGLLFDGRLRCAGSYANNDFLTLVQQASPPNQANGVTPQFFPFAFLTQIATLAGTSLVNYGKGVDQKWDKQESKNIRWQLGLTALGAIFSGFGTFISQPDPTREMLKSIIDSLEQLTQAIARVEQQLAQVKQMLAATNCNVTLINLEQYKNTIEKYRKQYLLLVGEAKSDVTAYTQGLPTIDPSTKIRNFIDGEKTAMEIQGAMQGIHNALMGTTLESPLDACMNKDYLDWKAVARHPFDDRHFYKSSYYQLYTAQAAETYGLLMLQDINAWKAHQSLVSPGDLPTNIELGQLAGFCAEIRAKATDPNPRWRSAQNYCDRNTDLVKSTYKDLVSEIEKAGAPYSDDHMVMSVGADLFYGSGKTHWLWLRDIGGQPDTIIRGHRGDWQMSGRFIDRGDANLYFEGDESKVATWRSDGRAWQELYENYQAYRDTRYPDKSKAPEEDMIESMAGFVDGFAEPGKSGTLFKNILSKPFWMTLRSFNMNWDVILYADPASSADLGCFVASGINKTDKDGFTMAATRAGKTVNIPYSQRGNPAWTPLTGKVCSDRELARASYSSWGMRQPAHFLSTTPTPYTQNQCGGQYPEYFCIGNGWPEGSSKGYQPYIEFLGNFDVRYKDSGGTANRKDWLGERKQAFFWPGQYGYLYRMPVLDPSQRECLTSIANPDIKRRGNKAVDGKPIPTRCGADLDSVVKSMIPMPEVPPMTDIRKP